MSQAPQVFQVSLQVTCHGGGPSRHLPVVPAVCGFFVGPNWNLSNTTPSGPWLQTCFFSGCTMVLRSLCLLLALLAPPVSLAKRSQQCPRHSLDAVLP